jgi:LysM repeat protein
MQRWAKASGYELVWDAMEVKLTGTSTVQAGDFLAAVKRVVGDLQKLNYPVSPQLYSDRVVRIYVKN